MGPIKKEKVQLVCPILIIKHIGFFDQRNISTVTGMVIKTLGKDIHHWVGQCPKSKPWIKLSAWLTDIECLRQRITTWYHLNYSCRLVQRPPQFNVWGTKGRYDLVLCATFFSLTHPRAMLDSFKATEKHSRHLLLMISGKSQAISWKPTIKYYVSKSKKSERGLRTDLLPRCPTPTVTAVHKDVGTLQVRLRALPLLEKMSQSPRVLSSN